MAPIGKLDGFVVATAVPVSPILVPSLTDALRITPMPGRRERVTHA